MALSATNPVTVSSQTASDHLALPLGEYVLEFASAGAFALDLQSASGSAFSDVYSDPTTKVTIDSSTGPLTVVVVGGRNYRMNVTTYNNPITMTASKCRN